MNDHFEEERETACIDDRETAIGKLRDAYGAKPTDKAAALDLAQAYCDRGWFNEALEIYAALVESMPGDAVLLLEYGNTLCKKGDYKSAKNVFLKITEINSGRIEGWNNLGIVQIKLNDTAAAHESFGRVLDIEPENTGALINMGNCFFSEGEFDKARSCFEKACSVHADLPDGWYDLGNTYIALGRLQDARLAFEKALRYCREFPSALKNLGWIHEHEGRLAEALQCYSEALITSKADSALYVNMGNVYVRQKKYDDAKKSFLTAIRLAPHELNGWMGLRGYALAKGDIDTFTRSTMAVLGRLSDDVLAQSIDILYELHQIDKADMVLAHADRLGRKSDLLDVQRLLLYQRSKSDSSATGELLAKLENIGAPADAVCRGLARYYLNEKNYDKALSWIGRAKEADASSRGIQWRVMLARGMLKDVRKQILCCTANPRENDDACFLLAVIEARLGHNKRAEILLVYALDHGFNDMEQIYENKVLNDIFESMAGSRHQEE